MTDQATPAKVRLTDVLGPWAPAPARTQWGEGMVEALVGIGRDETARIYADKAAAPLVAEAIFADYVRGRLAALRDHYAAQLAAAVAAERERLAAEFTKRAEALNTTGDGCAPHIQAQYEAMAGELLDWACSLKA